MKKLLTLIVITLFALVTSEVKAQNVQLLYDTDRGCLTSTVEMFRPDGLNNEMSYNYCWLGGLTYSGHSKDFSKNWSLSAMYKAIPGTVGLSGEKQVNNFQIIGVWGLC
ncbi:MAG: hypothetical protein IKY70_02370 [Bacteroidales bacterium]|nr:hypothetical protein [Bacteroidales bacterium]